jgi:hypothetical protein
VCDSGVHSARIVRLAGRLVSIHRSRSGQNAHRLPPLASIRASSSEPDDRQRGVLRDSVEVRVLVEEVGPDPHGEDSDEAIR